MGRDDTIAAIATAAGEGAVGIVRLSGADALAALRRSFLGIPERPASHRLYLGRVVDSDGLVVDEALAVWMRGPHSYTGEDVCEIQCHGGRFNLESVLRAVLDAGARLAEPGEYSLRAFLNGRLDLTRAEAVAAVIVAESSEALRVAQAQLSGSVERPIARLRSRLLDLLALLEATLDFAGEEHVYQLPEDEVRARIEEIAEWIGRMLAAGEEGRLRVGGIRAAFVGAPNAGKSSLFNAMLGRERAIVTEVAGTTRDTLEETTSVSGQRLHLIDTAGLRESADPIERLGMERTAAEIAGADLLLWVVDLESLGESLSAPDAVRGRVDPGRLVIVANKVDRTEVDADATPMAGRTMVGQGRRQRPAVRERVRHALPAAFKASEIVTISAATGEGVAVLEEVVGGFAARLQGRTTDDVPMVTSVRHLGSLRAAGEALARAGDAIGVIPLEMVAADVREATDALGEIIGAVATDEVLGRIFSTFCVGK